MMRNFKNLLMAGAAGVALLATQTGAQAGGFALREQSAVGLGNAFAGAAAGGAGLGSMFWNPATMTNYAGINSSLSLFAIMPVSKITPTGGFLPTAFGKTDSGDMAEDAVIPASYASWQFNDQVWLGLSLNVPFGLATKNPFNWSGQIYGRTSEVKSINATPTLGYRFSDQLSVGAGVQIMKFKVRLTRASSPAPGAESGSLEGDDTAFGFTLGATYKPFAGTEVGLGYRSKVKPKLEGSFYTPVQTSTGLVPGPYNIKGDLTLPDQVTIGLRQTINDDLTLLAGFEWTHWGNFGRYPVYVRDGASAGTLATTLYFDYRNSWFASLGAEYKLNPSWTLRSGLGFEHAPIDDVNRSVRLPDSNRIWTSLGATYAIDDRISLDLGYAHLFAKNGKIDVVSGNPNLVTPPATPATPLSNIPLTFNATTKGRVDIFAVGLNFKLGAEPKKTTTKAAMVTK
jgi:long-chain fatty acid transport protein